MAYFLCGIAWTTFRSFDLDFHLLVLAPFRVVETFLAHEDKQNKTVLLNEKVFDLDLIFMYMISGIKMQWR